MLKKPDKVLITEVEKNLDNIRDSIYKEVQSKKLSWFSYWQNKRREFIKRGLVTPVRF